MGEEADLLDDVADAAPEFIDIRPGYIRTVDGHGSLLRCQQAVHQLQRSGLAAAGAADHG